MPSIVRLRPGAPRPWAAIRHRSRYGLAEELRRDYLGRVADHLAPDDDVLSLVPPAARKDMLAGSEGRA